MAVCYDLFDKANNKCEDRRMKRREKLIAARMKRGLSQDAVSGLMGVSRNSYNQWELGNAQPHPYNVGRLCEFFYVKDPAELDLIPSSRFSPTPYAISSGTADSFEEMQKVNNSCTERINVPSSPEQFKRIYTLEAGISLMKENRRHFIQSMVNIAECAFAAPLVFAEMLSLEQFAERVTGLSKIDGFMLTQLETITRSHWYLFLYAPSKSHLLSSFWGHLQMILQLLKYPQLGAIRNRLYSIASESAQMIGEILFDMQEYQHSQNYYDFSIFAAKEAGNNALRAVGLGRLSFLPIYRDEPLQAYPLLEEAKQLLSSVSRPMISSWLAVVEAEMLAHLHDEVACEKALERAITHYHQEGSEEEKLWTRLNAATIPGYQGACYLQLQQPHKAIVALQNTLTCIPEYSPRHQSLILADMAAAMQQMKEVEEACTLLHNALEITVQTKSLMVLSRIQRVRKNLEIWKEASSVKQLDTSISQFLPGIMA
jgi:transcriptional regulator with XRE-family HTH domain